MLHASFVHMQCSLQLARTLNACTLCLCVQVSDKGLLPLSSLPNLLYLHLGNTRVRDEGMQYLARITSLHELHFAREAMTDFGIGQLSTLTNLQTLALRECPQVSSRGLLLLCAGCSVCLFVMIMQLCQQRVVSGVLRGHGHGMEHAVRSEVPIMWYLVARR